MSGGFICVRKEKEIKKKKKRIHEDIPGHGGHLGQCEFSQ
jgi:hypothetical protein